MSIDLKTITQLREMSGAGIGDCKAALEEAGGDLQKAIEVLRKKGEIKAAKKSDRATNEGVVAIAKEGDKLAAVAVACETDFVSRTEDFSNTVSEFAKQLLNEGAEGFRDKAETKIKDELVIKIGENIKLSDFGVWQGSVIGTYIHSNKKVAGIVVLNGGNEELANDIAMHITAMSPKYLKPEDVLTEEIAKEKEIYTEQLKGENKPEAIWDKIIAGKLAKYYEDVCLLNQVFIKDDSKKISDLLGDAQIIEFKKISV